MQIYYPFFLQRIQPGMVKAFLFNIDTWEYALIQHWQILKLFCRYR